MLLPSVSEEGIQTVSRRRTPYFIGRGIAHIPSDIMFVDYRQPIS